MTILGPLFIPFRSSEIPEIAIAIARLPDAELGRVSHAAIIYRDSQLRAMRVLDFTLNGDVRSSPIEAAEKYRYSWSIPKYSPIILGNIARLCESLTVDQPQFGYWLEFTDTTLIAEEGTAFKLTNGSIGLTCATFVLAVFMSQGLSILNLSSWATRDSQREGRDTEWQRKILSRIVKRPTTYGLSAAAVQKRAPNIPCLRYSPEDVVGGCRLGEYPAPFQVAEPSGRDVSRWIDESLSFL